VRTDRNGNRIDDGTRRADDRAAAGTDTTGAAPAGTTTADGTADGTAQGTTAAPVDDGTRHARHEAPRFDDGSGRSTR